MTVLKREAQAGVFEKAATGMSRGAAGFRLQK
jgi:hypothetical protein